MAKYCAFREQATKEIVYLNPELIQIIRQGSESGTARLILGRDHELTVEAGIDDIVAILEKAQKAQKARRAVAPSG